MMHDEQTATQRWENRARNILGGGPATYSKNPERFPWSAPKFAIGAQGYTVTDVEGRKYVDTVSALGAIVLGWDDPCVSAAVRNSIGGTSYSIGSIYEVTAAEVIAALYPISKLNMRVRFVKNGSDATEAAVRASRYLTNRQVVLCSGYHGFHDWYIASTDKCGGILPCIKPFTSQVPFLDRAAWENSFFLHNDDIAAVVIEIPPLPSGSTSESLKAQIGFLEWIRAETNKRGIVFVLDEVVTASRYQGNDGSALGLSAKFGIEPDFLCIGKGIANGYPLAAICGSRDVMDAFEGGAAFCSSTYGGETISLTACLSTLEKISEEHVISHIEEIGGMYKDALLSVIDAYKLPVELLGDYARMLMVWDSVDGVTADQLKTAWSLLHLEHNILYGGPIFPTFCWDRRLVFNLMLPAMHHVGYTIKRNIESGSFDSLVPLSEVTHDVFQRHATHIAEKDSGDNEGVV